MKIKPLLLPILIYIIVMVYPSIVDAQTVAVTGTITDTQSTPYSNGLLTVTFVNATGLQATFGGSPSFQKSYAIYLDSNGSFTVNLPPNSTASPSIQPAGTQWNFSYQSQGGYGAANINVTITGAGSISGTVSGLARITWPYGNIPPPGGSGQGIVFVSSTSLGWGSTGGGGGSVTHTAGNLTLNSMMLGNGVADAKVDTACVTNGTGALSGCTSIVTTGSISTGSGASSAGATATGGFAAVEATSTGWTPTAGQAYLRGSSVLDNFAVSIPLNGATETPLPVFNAVPAGSKCLQSSGVAGLIAEAAAACGTAGVVLVPATTAANTIAPTANSVVGLTVLGTTGTATDFFNVCTNVAGACGSKQFSIDSSGQVFIPGSVLANGPQVSVGGNLLFSNNGSVSYQLSGTATGNRLLTPPDVNAHLEGGICVNVTPVTLPGTSTTNDQNLMACTISAKALNVAGNTVRIRAKDVYTTAAGNLSTITRKFKLCSVSGCGSGNVTTLVSIVSSAQVGTITNDPILLDCVATTTTAGAASRFEASGDLIIDLSAATTAAESTFLDTNTGTLAGTPADLDITAQIFLQSTISFSIANAGNVATERQMTVEIIN